MISDAELAAVSPGRCLILSAEGRVGDPWSGDFAVLPGSFNPVHDGHWQLAAAAQRILAQPVLFELSIRNVDKPALGVDEVRARLAQFQRRAAVAVTCAPLFADKAALFSRKVFVVGTDTVVRLVDARYYGDDAEKMHEALTLIRDAGCRFLVAGRKDVAGRRLSLADITVSAEFRNLFTAIAPGDFQLDISSSQLRESK